MLERTREDSEEETSSKIVRQSAQIHQLIQLVPLLALFALLSTVAYCDGDAAAGIDLIYCNCLTVRLARVGQIRRRD